MNCWEYLLFVAVRTGQLTKPELVKLYKEKDGSVRAGMNNAAEIFAVGDTDLLGAGTLSIGDAIVFDIADRHVALSLGGRRVADMGGLYQDVSEVDIAKLVAHQNTGLTVEGLFGHLSLLTDRMQGHHDDVYDFRDYLIDDLRLKYDEPLPEPKLLADYIEELALKKQWTSEAEQAVRAVVSRVSTPPLYRIPKAVWIGRVKSHIPAGNE